MSDVRPEEDAFHKAISAIDNVVLTIRDFRTLNETLRRLALHLASRIEQTKPAPIGDWLE